MTAFAPKSMAAITEARVRDENVLKLLREARRAWVCRSGTVQILDNWDVP